MGQNVRNRNFEIIEIDNLKEDPLDFALWKSAKLGEPAWDSPWGKGRPGWHIECSAMSTKYLGETFDIHCGGVDNMFPHHENEIAQSEAASGKTFVNYWMHNEHLQVEGKKMSKRLGNFYTLRDLLAKSYDPIAIRYLLMSTHYRQQFNFTFEGLDAAKGAIDRLKNLVRRLHDAEGTGSEGNVAKQIAHVQQCFGEAMDDDLNISSALAALFDFVREINNLLDTGLVSKEEAAEVGGVMMQFDSLLGVVGKVEVDMSFEETADAVVVAGLATPETIDKFIKEAKRLGIYAIMDLMNVDDPIAKLRSLKRLPDVAILHRAIDAEKTGKTRWDLIKEMKQTFPDQKFLIAVAGGITPETAPEALANGADIIIVGRYITQSKDVERATREFLKSTKEMTHDIDLFRVHVE